MAKKKRKKSNSSKIKTPAKAEEPTVLAADAVLAEAQAKHEARLDMCFNIILTKIFKEKN